MLDLNDLIRTLKVGRSTVCGLWASGQLGSVKIGRRRLTTPAQLQEYIARLEGETA